MTTPGDGFREVRYFRRGSRAGFLVLSSLLVIGVALLAQLPSALRTIGVVAGLAVCVPLLLTFETVVAEGAMHLRVWPLWRKTINLADVESVELTVADGQVEVFGGWNSRENVVSALVAGVEGDRSVGNRAVVLHLRTQQRPQQVGTFRPQQLLAAIEAQRDGRS